MVDFSVGERGFEGFKRWINERIGFFLYFLCAKDLLPKAFGISSKLSRIACSSGSEPKAPGLGWEGDTLGYPLSEPQSTKSNWVVLLFLVLGCFVNG